MRKLEKYEKVGICCASNLVFTIMFLFIVFPIILNKMLSKEMSLAKGTDMREMWTKVPFPLDFKIYMFNYTNPTAIMQGSKPIVQEIGPYYFEEWKEKVNMVDIEEEDAIVYNRRDTFLFKREKSAPGLTGNEVIITPNLLIIAIIEKVVREKPTMMNFATKAINGVFDNPTNIFMETKVKDLLFDGIIINCDQTEYTPKMLCTALKKEKGLEILENGRIKFSVFGMKNGTIEEPTFKVLRGIRNIMDVGKVVEFGGLPSQKVWSGPKCNDYEGTDSTIFPPFLKEKDNLESFTAEICRSLPAWYERKSSYDGIKTNRYISDFGDLTNQPDLHCFCDSPTTCPKKGLMDLTKCLKAPFMGSLPHFLYADVSVQESVKGLKPEVEKHGINIDFEPITGTPLQAKKRLQFNVIVPTTKDHELFKNFSQNTLLPFMWIEEGVALNKEWMGLLKKQLFYPLKAVKILKWLMLFSGIFGIIGSGVHHYKHRVAGFAVSPESQNVTDDVSKKSPVFKNHKDLSITTVQSSQMNNHFT